MRESGVSAIPTTHRAYNRVMRQFVAKLGALLFVGGCSIIYNPNNITKPIDAAIDTPIDAPIDANPANLMLTDLAPAAIDEGQGAFGSRPAILVIHGSNFVASAQVEVSAMQTINIHVDNTHVMVSGASDYLAVPVTADVDSNLHEGTNVPLKVTVTQPTPTGMTSQSLDGMVKLHGHEELNSAPTGTPASIYSQIQISNAMTFNPGSSSSKFVLTAVSSISIGAITAKGGNGSGGTGGTAGIGACAGAGAQGDAACDGGGKGGNTPGILGGVGGDGGGAGFATNGLSGTGGTGPGIGGLMHGDDMLADYSKNQPSGGGGGGGNGLTGSGGSGGGGGGGMVELTAGGDITINGDLNVSGGVGANSSGGAGGGGAGGTLMIRAGGMLTQMSGSFIAAGGGGAGGSMTDGKGSDGRVRWDATAGAPPTAMPAAVRGPSFAASTQLVIRTTSIDLVGTSPHKFDVYWRDANGVHNDGVDAGTAFDANGNANIKPPLMPGFATVCITIMGGTQGASEADKCIDVAYLP